MTSRPRPRTPRPWGAAVPVAAAVLALAGCGGSALPTPEGLPTVEDLEPYEVEYVIRQAGYQAVGDACREIERQVMAGESAQVEYGVDNTGVTIGIYAYPDAETAAETVAAVAASTVPCTSESYTARLEPDAAQDIAEAVGVTADQVTAQSGELAEARLDRSVVDLGDGRVVITSLGLGHPQPAGELVRVSTLAVEAARNIEGLPDLEDVPYVP